MRSCEGCTKCCEGFIPGEVRGNKFYFGKPCPFVIVNNSCSIYEDRPISPCKTFQCSWIEDDSFPDEWKPNKIGIIIRNRDIDGQRFLQIVEAPNSITEDFIETIKEYCFTNNMFLAYQINQIYYFWGSKDFVQKISKIYLDFGLDIDPSLR